MTFPLLIDALFQPLITLLSGCAVAMIGFGLGRLLTALIGDRNRLSIPLHRGIEGAATITAVGLWWWEVQMLGQVLLGDNDNGAAVAGAALLIRYAAHLLLFTLLAAAAWIDIRERVIPDSITVPGVLVGLLAVWPWPGVLLPIDCEVLRSFAPPRLQPDLLGLFGGLRSSSGIAWLGGWPWISGLLVSLVIFLTWCLICTAPSFDSHLPRRHFLEPRTIIFTGGTLLIITAWLIDGQRYFALQSSLVGLAVSAGVVLAIRAGASWALGREAMGLGDVTLMAMVGVWLGWQACVLAFFLAAFIGLAHGVWHLLLHREHELPFGPSLCLASAFVVIAWRPIWARVGFYFEEPLEMALVVGSVIVLTAVTLSIWQKLRGLPVP